MTQDEFCKIVNQEGYESYTAGEYIDIYSTELDRYIGFAFLDSTSITELRYVSLHCSEEKRLHIVLTIYGAPVEWL